MTAVTSADTSSPRSGAITSGALVGRAGELSQLVDVVGQPPAVAVVAGEAGVGKTRLVDELRAREQAAGRRVVVGACRQIRDPFPLFPVVEAMRQLREPLRGAALSPVAGAVRPLLPELSDLLPPAPEPAGDGRAEQHRVFRALLELLRAAGPVLVVLEDLHWADAHTPDFLRYLLADPPAGLSLVLTYREEEVAAAVRALPARLAARVRRAQVRLAPLDAAGAGALAAAILGTDQISEAFASYLCERASGLPFAIEELLALLRAQGSMVYRRGGWARQALDRLDVPARIRDQVLARVSHLSPEAQAVLQAAAVLHAPVPIEVLTASGELPAEVVRAGVEEALSGGVLSESPGRVGFRHVLAAEAVYESIPDVRRRLMHARAAAALRTLEPPPLGEVARHLRQAGRDEAWVDAAELAAEQAGALGHDAQAVQVLEEVLRHASLTDERAGRVALALGHTVSKAVAGGGDSAAELLAEVLERKLSPPVRGELSLLTAVVMDHGRTDMTRQRELCRVAVAQLDPGHHGLRAWAMACLGIPFDGDVPLAEHRQWQQRAVAELAAVDNPRTRVQLLGKLAMVQVMTGDHQWRELVTELDRVVAEIARTPSLSPQDEAWSYYAIAVAACYAGHHDTAADLLAQASSYPESWGHPFRDAVLRSAHTLVDYCRGDWDGLLPRADRLVDQLVEFAPARAEAQLVAGCLRLAQGALGQARAGMAALSGADADISGGGIRGAATVRLALAEGDLPGAAALVARQLAAVRRQGIWAPVGRCLPVMVEALIATGDLAGAQDLVATADTQLRPLDVPLADGAVLLANGLLAAARRRWQEAAAGMMAAADSYRRLRCPYESAQAMERAAQCQFEAGDPAAGESLRDALTTYQRLGARWDRDRAAGLARRYGVAPPARHRRGRRGYGDQLSPREREVARLVAAGRTNQEIAAELYLSVSTVEKHVAAVLRKLDARSRRRVGERIGGEVGHSPQA